MQLSIRKCLDMVIGYINNYNKEMLIIINNYEILIISNKEINDIMKIIKYLEETYLLIKGVSDKIKNEPK